MRKWAFHSQVYFLTHKFRIHQQVQQHSGLAVVDRTIYEDAEIFAKGLYRDGNMADDDFALYWDLYQNMCESLRPPDLLIYLTCRMQTLTDRIRHRARNAEKNVPEAYLRRLQRDYDDWIGRFDCCEVITLETDDLDYLSDLVHRKHVIERLSKYL
jgi:deoxyadenosine/deoxycytidine kinase